MSAPLSARHRFRAAIDGSTNTPFRSNDPPHKQRGEPRDLAVDLRDEHLATRGLVDWKLERIGMGFELLIIFAKCKRRSALKLFQRLSFFRTRDPDLNVSASGHNGRARPRSPPACLFRVLERFKTLTDFGLKPLQPWIQSGTNLALMLVRIGDKLGQCRGWFVAGPILIFASRRWMTTPADMSRPGQHKPLWTV